MMTDPKLKDRTSPQKPDEDNNLGRGAPFDREERLQQRAHNAERGLEEDPQDQNRAAHDLDRDDAELRREATPGKKPDIRGKKSTS
jgi:hypothetical protein